VKEGKLFQVSDDKIYIAGRGGVVGGGKKRTPTFLFLEKGTKQRARGDLNLREGEKRKTV